MIKIGHTKAQAATELAVFGAILIFLIGTIVRSAVGNSYTQNQNFKAMRMAMLASWNGSKAGSTARNNATVLFVEDRLSPDTSKYGDLDRNPFIAQGSGTFSYELMYPISGANDAKANLPLMDVYINGQHFPFTTASYIHDKAIVQPSSLECSKYTPYSCLANQCWRNYREWAGGKVLEKSFITPTVAPLITKGMTKLQKSAEILSNACTIFNDLSTALVFRPGTIKGTCADGSGSANIADDIASPVESSPEWAVFANSYEAEPAFANNTVAQNTKYLNAIAAILDGEGRRFKLFYTLEANPGENAKALLATSHKPRFTLGLPPEDCPSHPCKDKELSSDMPLMDYTNNPTTDADGNSTNVEGVMQYDLLRLANYNHSVTLPSGTTIPSVLSQFPATGCPNCLRNYIAWQWSANAGTGAAEIGLDTGNNQYPTYDINGTLKEVTIYKISQPSGTTLVDYEDPAGGDIDQSWDINSCGTKPGLGSTSNVFTFTSPTCLNGVACPSSGVCPEGTSCGGTYLQINEGKLYNPESGRVVRSANKRDSIDLIQRSIQLSNNTGRFCTLSCADGSVCGNTFSGQCDNGSMCTTTSTAPSHVCGTDSKDVDCASPNPVEVCEDESTPKSNCFTGQNANGQIIAQTCYDTLQKVMFVRSRLQDQRGRFWMTNASGQLEVH